MIKRTVEEFRELASKLSRSGADDDALQVLEQIAQSPAQVRQFVEVLITFHIKSGMTDIESIERSLIILEAVTEKSPLPGCAYLFQLKPFANNLYMHDVCDAIDLWLNDHNFKAT